jgi:hypothetical protein
MGYKIAPMPNIKPILAILLPTIFPIEMPLFCSIAATILTTNSGAEVPNDTIVNPITTGLTPNDSAIRDAFRIISSAPTQSSTKPTMKIENSNIIFCGNILYGWD